MKNVAGLAAALAAVLILPASAADPLPNRPDFRLPFPCGSSIEIKTYYGHNPDDKKMDMYRHGMPNGSPILAAADGVVHQAFYPGGIEIRHANGWFTTYMHMSWNVPVGTVVKRGQQVGSMGTVGTSVPHLHHEQLYAPGRTDADNVHITYPLIQGEGPMYLNPNTPLTRTSTNCAGTSTTPEPTPAPTPGKYWVDTFANATGYNAPASGAVGTLYSGTSYVYCKVWGPEVRTGDAFNHWWLKTDLDTGQTNKWVSAYYLSRWGNDVAKDNYGTVIPTCATPKYYVDTFANAPARSTPGGTQTGTLYAGTNYVYCKVWGPVVGNSATYNHWWLKTDPDVGPANQWVSAYYLSRWGNDVAKDNNGVVIPNCT
jgi:hypothetical protein